VFEIIKEPMFEIIIIEGSSGLLGEKRWGKEPSLSINDMNKVREVKNWEKVDKQSSRTARLK
jgi:hypothetical protein